MPAWPYIFNPRNYGALVCLGSCRILSINLYPSAFASAGRVVAQASTSWTLSDSVSCAKARGGRGMYGDVAEVGMIKG